MIKLFDQTINSYIDVEINIIGSKVSTSYMYFSLKECEDEDKIKYLRLNIKSKLITTPEYFIEGYEQLNKLLYDRFHLTIIELLKGKEKNKKIERMKERQQKLRSEMHFVQLSQKHLRWADEVLKILQLPDKVDVVGFLYNCWPRKLGDQTEGMYYGEYQVGINNSRINEFSEKYFKSVLIHELAHFVVFSYKNSWEYHGAIFLLENYKLHDTYFGNEIAKANLLYEVYFYGISNPDEDINEIELLANHFNLSLYEENVAMDKLNKIKEEINVVNEWLIKNENNKNKEYEWSFHHYQTLKMSKLKNDSLHFTRLIEQFRRKKIEVVGSYTTSLYNELVDYKPLNLLGI